VWRAYDELLTREVAAKQLANRHPGGLAEARIAARVRHPSVATVHDAIRHEDSDWLVMDYHRGGTLADLVDRRRRLPPPIVAALGVQLVAALTAVHAAGVVHCDVKPENLLLGEDGRLILIDFGVAEIADTGHPARQAGEIVGSPAYIAPELLRGEAPRPAADLWSLAATLYTAVEGHPPFSGVHTGSTLAAVLLAAPGTSVLRRPPGAAAECPAGQRTWSPAVPRGHPGGIDPRLSGPRRLASSDRRHRPSRIEPATATRAAVAFTTARVGEWTGS
jgi:serine/threonine protein kinase